MPDICLLPHGLGSFMITQIFSYKTYFTYYITQIFIPPPPS